MLLLGGARVPSAGVAFAVGRVTAPAAAHDRWPRNFAGGFVGGGNGPGPAARAPVASVAAASAAGAAAA